MLDNLYDNIGGKIKSLAKWTFIIEAISAVIAGIVIMASHEDFILYGLLTFFIGPVVAWVSSWLLYAFGELVENVKSIKNKYVGESNTCNTEKAQKDKTEPSAKSCDEERTVVYDEKVLEDKFNVVITKKAEAESDEKLDLDEEEKLKAYIEKALEEKSKSKEILDLYWQYKKYNYGYYPKAETKEVLEEVIKKCEAADIEGNSQLMIAVSKRKLSDL